ncbi:MAG: Spy/CpxP family protein refolding chaperone [Verrucomicrobia bacterium]|nr:Spy/CpxP family protein refolding chaperone [Verrucomicrobiota bacterium]
MKWKSLMLSLIALAGFTAAYAQQPDAAASASASPSAEAGFHKGWAHHRLGFLIKKLNLNDTQKQQLKDYFSQNKQAFKANMANLLNARKALTDAMDKNPSDETTIRSLSANVESARTELTVQRAKFQAFLQGILTNDQKQTLTALQQKRNAKLQEHIQRLSQSNS